MFRFFQMLSQQELFHGEGIDTTQGGEFSEGRCNCPYTGGSKLSKILP